MVLLHMKKSDAEQFLYETTVTSSVKGCIEELVSVFNMRQKILRLKIEGEELAKYGPAKRPDQQGLDEYAEEGVEKGPHYAADPTGRRTGNACNPETAKVLMKTLEDGATIVDKGNVEKKLNLTKKALEDALDNIRGAVMICYPMGLPEWDFVRQSLEDEEDGVGAASQFGIEDMVAAETTMWFAGKQMLNEKKLSDYFGRHEKTKAIVKLQKKGGGAPAREPVVDQDTQKAMMAWYYKKQEEQKKLGENEDDSYADSSWANPKSLKSHFAGMTQVRLPK